MKSYRRQRGISIWLAAVLFISLACIGLVALKLFPVYMESLKIDRALTALGATCQAASRGPCVFQRASDRASVPAQSHRTVLVGEQPRRPSPACKRG